VSPSALPAPPEAARELFGVRLPAAEAYARLLAGPGVERGLIGPAEAARIWDRHLLNCAVVADLVPERCRLADLGSGAGLPGLVLAMLRPLTAVILVEPMARRTAFLAECAEQLGLNNVEVRRARAEELAGQIRADVVTARAVASLDRLAGPASGLARPGGLVLAMKGTSAAVELRRSMARLQEIGATQIGILRLGEGTIAEPTTVVRFVTGSSPAASTRSRRHRAGRPVKPRRR
jgi:16S rRNA (guanine527-N7)-methyltransferase